MTGHGEEGIPNMYEIYELILCISNIHLILFFVCRIIKKLAIANKCN